MLLLIYSLIGLYFVFITYSKCISETFLHPNISAFNLFINLLLYVFVFALLAILTPFTIFHFWLIFTGKTTLEYCESKVEASGQYNCGLYNNFIFVFGTNPLFWFLPLGVYTVGEGVIFEQNQK
eukprot:TRINITY_DN17379_c0_g2_i4.p3 TRINITY_DN17379_c0_g2~~TRINITY_DN17379_c0_g2_i4.p3  ORF type:complete len:124 (-),score=1.40 TRINITY_DN17379_c0_g2_i4:79-450(-)